MTVKWTIGFCNTKHVSCQILKFAKSFERCFPTWPVFFLNVMASGSLNYLFYLHHRNVSNKYEQDLIVF